MLKEKNCQLRNIYPEINTFRNKDEKETFSTEGKLKKKKFIATRTALREFLEETLQTERK